MTRSKDLAATRGHQPRRSSPTWSSTTPCRSTSTASPTRSSNMDIEYQRNGERYQFLRFSGSAGTKNFRVVPPGTGIIHQVSIEYLAKVVMSKAEANGNARLPRRLRVAPTRTPPPKTVWACSAGASAASRPRPPCSPADLHARAARGRLQTHRLHPGERYRHRCGLTITDMLRKHGVVGKFRGILRRRHRLRAAGQPPTIGNMGPEFGSTCGIFRLTMSRSTTCA